MKYIYVLGVSVLPRSAILIFDFGIVPTAWYVLFFYFIVDHYDANITGINK
jgi:hypothetical protein